MRLKSIYRAGKELASVWPGSLSLTRSQVICVGPFIARELASSGPSLHLSFDHLDSPPDSLMSERVSRRHVLLIRFADLVEHYRSALVRHGNRKTC